MQPQRKKLKITDYFDKSVSPRENEEQTQSFQSESQKMNQIDHKKVENSESLESQTIDESGQNLVIQVKKLSDVLTDDNLIDLVNDDDNLVLFKLPYEKNTVPQPLSKNDDFAKLSDYIELPHQEMGIFINEGVEFDSKWSLIQKVYQKKIENIYYLEKAIKSYNKSIEHIPFDILRNYIHYELSKEEREVFFDNVLPSIIRLALSLPELIHWLPRLNQGKSVTLFLSQQQISSLVANAFLCTFRSSRHLKKNPYCINFHNLFATNHCNETKKSCKLEKLKCFINYLRRVIQKTPTGTVSVERKQIDWVQNFSESKKPIRNFSINFNQCLVKGGVNYSQVDFAHKLIGGGILDSGCVQEEILFALCPELLVAKLVNIEMLDNEAIVITGVEQYSLFSGYAQKFRWKSSYTDASNCDKYGRRFRQILAMDAMYFFWRNKSFQYQETVINREILKAMCAFQKEKFIRTDRKIDQLPAIATGNWGCGVYNADPNLKTLIQLVAASQADRDLIYFAFDNLRLYNDFKQLRNLILERQPNSPVTVADIYCLASDYAVEKSSNRKISDLVSFFRDRLNSKF